jgi:hypothetical protein
MAPNPRPQEHRNASARAAEPPIRIGVVATTQGSAGLLGSCALKSIQLARDGCPSRECRSHRRHGGFVERGLSLATRACAAEVG